MGAWSPSIWDNDDAVDWLTNLMAKDDSTLLGTTLEASELENDYLECPKAAKILCACEIIAALCGRPSSDLPTCARAWIDSHLCMDVSLIRFLAEKRVDRVLSEGSELDELWRENEAGYDTWRNNVISLKARLVAANS